MDSITVITSQQGKVQLLISNYTFSFKEELKSGEIKWTCKRGCRANVYTVGDKYIISRSNFDHNHAPHDDRLIQRRIISTKCKEEVTKQVFLRPSQILGPMLKKNTMYLKTSDLQYIKRNMHNARKKLEVSTIIESSHLPDNELGNTHNLTDSEPIYQTTTELQITASNVQGTAVEKSTLCDSTVTSTKAPKSKDTSESIIRVNEQMSNSINAGASTSKDTSESFNSGSKSIVCASSEQINNGINAGSSTNKDTSESTNSTSNEQISNEINADKSTLNNAMKSRKRLVIFACTHSLKNRKSVHSYISIYLKSTILYRKMAAILERIPTKKLRFRMDGKVHCLTCDQFPDKHAFRLFMKVLSKNRASKHALCQKLHRQRRKILSLESTIKNLKKRQELTAAAYL